MKKKYLLAITALLMMVVACDTQKQKEEAARENSKVDSLELVINQMRNEADDLNEMKFKISDIMRQINEAEGRVANTPIEGTNQQVIIENMAFIQQKMNEYRKTVDEMQQQLRNANQISKNAKKSYQADIANYVKELKQKNEEILRLRELLAEKDVLISSLDSTITMQNEKMSHLTSENEAKEQALIAQDQKIHTAWYVFGTKSELEDENILVKGKVMQSTLANTNYFTKIDIRITKTIKLYSKKVRILTSHPSDSYSLDEDAQGLYTLRISNPEKFWSVSRYLVITVK